MTEASPAKSASSQRRELEQAPLHLRKASKILIGGAVLPWLTAVATEGHMPWGHWAASVALTFLAGWILIESAKATHGLPANGAVAGVAKAHPLAGTGVAMLVFIGACAVAWIGNSWFDGDPAKFTGVASETASDRYSARALLELGVLLLGLATFAHILAYEHGGKFNPIFPLMFLGPALSGSFQLIGAFGQFSKNAMGAAIGVVGSLTVAAAGFMAIYTMYESMKQAKIEGDLKRAAQAEARKAARASGGGGGGTKRAPRG